MGMTRQFIYLCFIVFTASSVVQADWRHIDDLKERSGILQALYASLTQKNWRIKNCDIKSRTLINRSNNMEVEINNNFLYVNKAGTSLLLSSVALENMLTNKFEMHHTTFILNDPGTDVVDVFGDEFLAVSRNTGTITKPKWITELQRKKQVTCN
jgi:hypothetical protein